MVTKDNYVGQDTKIPGDTAAKLRGAARASKAFEAMCHVFATRERTRRQLTLRAVHASIRMEGFDVAPPDTARAFRALDSLGIGRLFFTGKGQVEGLRDIKYDLSAVAEAALSSLPAAEPPASLFAEPPPVSRKPVTPDHLTNATVPPLNAKPVPATTLAAPVSDRMVSGSAQIRHLTNAQPKVAGGEATVTVSINGKDHTFTLSVEEAKKIVLQLL